MPYKDKEKAREYQRKYGNENRAFLSLKRRRLRERMSQSFDQNVANLSQSHVAIPTSTKEQVINSLRQQIEQKAYLKKAQPAEMFKDDYVLESVFDA